MQKIPQRGVAESVFSSRRPEIRLVLDRNGAQFEQDVNL